jgi:hypothetical protein
MHLEWDMRVLYSKFVGVGVCVSSVFVSWRGGLQSWVEQWYERCWPAHDGVRGRER